jgi:glutamate 5-kinase
MIDNSKPKGQLFLDDGAIKALLENKKSLLPVGVKRFSGNFQRGDLLSCMNQDGVEVARGLSNFSSIDVERIMGQKTDCINQPLENIFEENLIHRNNLVII